MNNILVEKYLGKTLTDDENKRLKTKTNQEEGYISFLNNTLIDWTYEVLGDDIINGVCHVTIALYLPGRVWTGFGMQKAEVNKNIKFLATINAIKNACLQIGVGVNKDKSNDVPNDNTQNTGKPKYKDEQIARMLKFKENYKVTNDDMFVKYLQTWDSKINDKRQLTPNNIDAFLTWVDSLETERQ